uniref:Uncharacterized protein n=1 Tax=Tanacetum cinerariifolium TaxID=118510 RepID=A0A6L2P1R0_TANCI|nr:hypothetical protein [Tanacetum cinerariifolium]
MRQERDQECQWIVVGPQKVAGLDKPVVGPHKLAGLDIHWAVVDNFVVGLVELKRRVIIYGHGCRFIDLGLDFGAAEKWERMRDLTFEHGN